MRGANPRRVTEESQIEEMRAAMRGDRERAEQARQRSSESVRALVERPPGEPRHDTPPAETVRRRGLFGFLRRR